MNSHLSRPAVILLVWLVGALYGDPALAGEPAPLVELSNNSDAAVAYRIAYADDDWAAAREFTLGPQKSHSYGGDRPLLLKFGGASDERQYVLTPGLSYHFEGGASGSMELHRTLRPGDPPVRELGVRAVVDLAYQGHFPRWNDRIQQLVSAVSGHFEANFGIRLNLLGCETWHRFTLPGVNETPLIELFHVDPLHADLVIGFTVLQLPQRSAAVELASTACFGQHVVFHESTDGQIAARAALVLLHELCHVFGAFHLNDRRSVMQPMINTVPRQVSVTEATRQVIRLTRTVDLRQGVESLDDATVERIRQLHRAHRHAASEDDDPIVAGYAYRVLVALQSGDTVRARTLAEQTVARSPGSLRALMLLGGTALSVGDSAEAERRFRQAVRLKPQCADAHVGLGFALLLRGDVGGALQSAERAIRLSPSHEGARGLRDACRQLAQNGN